MSTLGYWVVALVGILLIFRMTEGCWSEALRLTGQALALMVAITTVLLIWVWSS